ncbi:MAG: NUDIX domain-containing protein [bacterium]|nr:NUDIX domain-containing protein [bacterium]
MRETQIAATVICEVDKYHLQFRNGAKQRGAIGLTGLFGGKVKSKETSKKAACRELEEETNLTPSLEQLRQVDSFAIEETRKILGLFPRRAWLNVDVFQLLLERATPIDAKEGQLVTMTGEEIKDHMAALSPVARKFFEEFLP